MKGGFFMLKKPIMSGLLSFFIYAVNMRLFIKDDGASGVNFAHALLPRIMPGRHKTAGIV